MKYLLLILALTFTQAWAAPESVDDLWQRLKDDFESKPYFFNLGDNLTPLQISKLPAAKFLDKKPFALAMAGRERLLKAGKIKNFPILTVVDFSLHQLHRRMFILDLEKAEVLVNAYTSHAEASDRDGDGFAETFSNVSGSLKSSVGFMSTDVSYYGNYGYSLRLRGHDPKLNSHVLARAVVVHGFSGLDAQQASQNHMSLSEGCLMVSRAMLEEVIGILKPGGLVFSYTEAPLIFESEWIKKTDLPSPEIASPTLESLPFEYH